MHARMSIFEGPPDKIDEGVRQARAIVERKIAELVRPHGLRQGRYFGEEKTDLQAVFTATMVNTKRLFTLSVEDTKLTKKLRRALAA